MIIAAAIGGRALNYGWDLYPGPINSADSGGTVTVGGLKGAYTGDTAGRTTVPIVGKKLWHVYCAINAAPGSTIGIGTAAMGLNKFVGFDNFGWGYYANDGKVYNGLGNSSAFDTYTAADIVSIAFDADSYKLWVAKNGVWQNSGDPVAGTGQVATVTAGIYYFALGSASGNVTGIVSGKFTGF